MNAQTEKKQNQQPQEKIPVPNQPKQAPIQEPDTKKQVPIVGNEKGAALPYVVAWLLGVPVSLLLLVALFRAIFN